MSFNKNDSHCKTCKYKNSKICKTECKNGSIYARDESRDSWYVGSIEEAASNARMRASRRPYTPGRHTE